MSKSSEEIIGLELQPRESCPQINKDLEDVDKLADAIRDAFRAIKYEEELKSISSAVDDIQYYTSDLEDHFEYCRTQCEKLRAWGQSWKDLAKQLINQYEPELLIESCKK